MISFAIFVLATIGLTNIIVHGKILDVIGLRDWLRLRMSPESFQVFECYECTGFWAGMFMSVILINDSFGLVNLILPVICGFAGSVLSQSYTDLQFFVRSHTVFEVSDDQPHDT